MHIIKADVLGMCFGVRDALAIIDAVNDPEAVTIHGELVHNEKVLDDLADRGFNMLGEKQRQTLPMTQTVLITAHGISDKERTRLKGAGKELIDTTCPLVTRAHQAAQKLRSEGRYVLVIGKRGHVEVQGIIEDLASYDVLQSPDEVRAYPHAKLGVMCQTTTPVRHADEIVAAIRAKNPQADIRVIDTICHPTKDHQKALDRLMGEVEAMVVVGGHNSNNTRQLVLRCQARGLPAYHVQGPEDLRPEWFDGIETVGLTAGTSTLDATIDAVEEALHHIAHQPALV
ncbi:MAG: 4-hydroxy-3-methylbut-2-enyl diphosphate reductase [Planctomycetes bacterium]|nr:4-hydroxy-3-methylbut-2-enyl diphosphate reductase [Planctomycetota bacterium]